MTLRWRASVLLFLVFVWAGPVSATTPELLPGSVPAAESQKNAALARELAAEVAELEHVGVELKQAQAAAARRESELKAAIRAAEADAAREIREPLAASLELSLALRSAEALVEQLQIQATELPDRDIQDTRLRAISTALNSDEPGGVLGELLKLTDEWHQRDTSASVTRVRLWTARGEREDVDWLRVGGVVNAYRTPDQKRVGLSVPSPEDALGFRWVEELPHEVRNTLHFAFNEMAAGGASELTLPVDPTGTLTRVVPRGQEFAQTFKSGGPVMWPLALIALFALVIALERAWVLYGVNRTPHSLLQEVLSPRPDFDRALHLCREQRGAVAKTLLPVLRRRQEPLESLEDCVQERLLHEAPRLQRWLGGLALLGGIAPLLGLLGTVTGIIHTFKVIHAFGNSDPGLMAGGISEALTTTAAGLIIAVPIFITHGILKGRMERVLSDAERSAATALTAIHAPAGAQEAVRTPLEDGPRALQGAATA